MDYSIRPKYLIIDSGVSYSLIPALDFMHLRTELTSYGVNCENQKGDELVTAYHCTFNDYAKLPDIQLTVESDPHDPKSVKKPFNLPKESYMEQTSPGVGKMKILPNDINFGSSSSSAYWVMGAIFLHNYYSIYDFKQMKMGLVEARLS